MKPFNHNYFLGYINEITPQYVKIHFPSSNLLNSFYYKGLNFAGGNVGKFVIIEGIEYGFLAMITELSLPDSERKEINEKILQEDTTLFHPSGKAELLLVFSLFDPKQIEKSVSKYPHIGAKVYACSDIQISKFIERFGGKKEENTVYAQIGKLVSDNVMCNVSLDSLFGRHCAVIGTTGGGKSWTVAKLIEQLRHYTKNKVILIDATGEYKTLQDISCTLGVDSYFPYQKLSISDLFYLLTPTEQSQRPILLEAIRSLKMQHVENLNEVYVKAYTLKSKYQECYQKNSRKIENNLCDFNINLLVEQIKEECVDIKNTEKWGGFASKTYEYQTSLILRVIELLNNDIFNKLLGFNNIQDTCHSVIDKIESFLCLNTAKILRVSFEDVPSMFSAKEIVSNALATYLLHKARDKNFIENPIVLFLDEAHQFLNKEIKCEMYTLDAFNLIAKEARKYGLFLCISTQMPKDIPIETLSQMGTFIVHRLINDSDKKVVENAISYANKNITSFLPMLGTGEALLTGVDFPTPLLLKFDQPENKPNSETPKLILNNL